MEKPLTYLDRCGGNYSEYLFISYSYKDIEQVYPILNELYSCGVNYWYDTEVEPGDEWNEEVENVIFDKYCVGTLIFLSAKSIYSDSIYEEIKRINEKNDKNKHFKIIPIIIDKCYKKWEDLISDSLGKQYLEFIEKEYEFRKLFKQGYRVCLFGGSEDSIANTIFEIVRKKGFISNCAVNIRDSSLGRIGLITINGYYYIELGKLKMQTAKQEKVIRWKLISRKNNLFYFVSEYCLDFVTIDNINSTIRNIDIPDEYKEYVKITIINEEFIENYKDQITDFVPTDYADEKRNHILKLYWVKDNNGKTPKGYCFYNSVKKRIDKNINCYCVKAGLRLLLIIDDEKLKGE